VPAFLLNKLKNPDIEIESSVEKNIPLEKNLEKNIPREKNQVLSIVDKILTKFA